MAGTGRATAVTKSALAATAAALQRRADELFHRAEHPFTRDQIALIALAARDASTWLLEAGTNAERLREVEASLTAQSAKLNELEDLLRGR